MRDPRTDPVPAELLESDRVQPPTVVAFAQAVGVELDDWQREVVRRAYTPPKPPPAELGVDIDKWRHMNRAQRRAAIRAGRR
jgi:hypothetical protein